MTGPPADPAGSADPADPAEVRVDRDLAARLVREQFPRWASRELHVPAGADAGSDHVLFRLGDDLAVRFPRRAGTTRRLEKERRHLPALARALPVAVAAR